MQVLVTGESSSIIDGTNASREAYINNEIIARKILINLLHADRSGLCAKVGDGGVEKTLELPGLAVVQKLTVVLEASHEGVAGGVVVVQDMQQVVLMIVT